MGKRWKPKSPFDFKVSVHAVGAAASEYEELTGLQIFQKLGKPGGGITLLIDAMTPNQQKIGPIQNWKALEAIQHLIQHAKHVKDTTPPRKLFATAAV